MVGTIAAFVSMPIPPVGNYRVSTPMLSYTIPYLKYVAKPILMLIQTIFTSVMLIKS